jgi:cytochrome P450
VRCFSSANVCPVTAAKTAAPVPPKASGPLPNVNTKPFLDIPSPPSQAPMGTFGDLQERLQKHGFRGGVSSYYYDYGHIIRHDMVGQHEVWCFDPNEYLKVMSKQGKYPSTAVGEVKSIQRYNADRNRPTLLSTNDEVWKTQRTALQKDLFNPPDAASYAKTLDPAVRSISQAAPKFDRLSSMTTLAAMDMFCSVMLGYFPNVTGGEVGDGKCDPDDRAFVVAATNAMEYVGVFGRDPVGRTNPELHKDYPAFCSAMDDVYALSSKRVAALGGARIHDIAPYMERLLERGEVETGNAGQAVQLLLFAGVDTTHHVLQWSILNLALNPRVQEKIYEEAQRVIGKGALEVEHLTQLPYMSQFLRENHRKTPPFPGAVLRRLEEDVDVCGYLIPKNTRLTLMSDAIQNDPKIAERPEEFLPERWADEAVAKRKGTPQQVLDHQMLAKPFGYGARMCLGARVAELEIKALLARMVRDWNFAPVDPSPQYNTIQGLMLKPDPFPKLKFEPRH